MRHLAPGVAALSIAVALAGCGDADDQPVRQAPAVAAETPRGVLETIDALAAASRAGRGEEICPRVFTPRLVRSIEAAAGRDCAEEVGERLGDPDAAFSLRRDVDVDGRRATAVIQEANGDVSTLHLVNQAGRWHVDRLVPTA